MSQRGMMLRLLLFCFCLIIGGAPLYGQYVSTQIWATPDGVYATSTTSDGGYKTSVSATLCRSTWPGGCDEEYIDGASCEMSTATVTLSLNRVPNYYYTAYGAHSEDSPTTGFCYVWDYYHMIGYGTRADLDLRFPIINYFYANTYHITPPGSVTLFYGTSVGTSLNINGTPVSPGNGSLVVSPTVTTTYTLTVTNAGATAQASVTVWVAPPPNPLFHKYSVRHEKGTSSTFPMLPLQGESVNSANGNMLFQVPLLSRPGRNGLGVNLSLAYNSKIWDFFVQSSTLYATLAEPDSWVGVGWTLLIGRIMDDSANGHYYLTLSDGSNHDFTYYGSAWRSNDSAYMIYDPATHRLTLKGGMIMKFDHVDEARSYARYATRVQDTNGNYIDINYADYGGRISSIQDTLGNTYTFLLNSNGRLQYIKYWNTLDTTQATTTITFNYQTLSLAFGTGGTTDPALPTQWILTSVVYPSGMQYVFNHAASGEITSITYPTCAVSNYAYLNRTVYDRLLGQTVPEHWVSSHNLGDANTWAWSYRRLAAVAKYDYATDHAACGDAASHASLGRQMTRCWRTGCIASGAAVSSRCGCCI